MHPAYEVADILHSYAKAFLKQHPQAFQVLKTLDALSRCRTASMGGHKSSCSSCGYQKYHYNSCRNRHCPRCQATNRERWIMQRESELLPVAYYHIVFTLPSALHQIALAHPKEVYNSLFHSAWGTIETLAGEPKYLGAKTGMVAVLHTWGQQLWIHPHLHCIVSGGGLSGQGKWKHARGKKKYLFPQKAMGTLYRAKFVSRLRSLGVVIPQKTAKALFSKDWVVFAKKPFASPKTVVEYLGRYTHKIAISNHRLVSIHDGMVRFRYKDYRKGAMKLQMELTAVEFLRRFCLHILPKGFVRMRHYGILASRNKAKELNLAKKDLGEAPWQKLTIDFKEVLLKSLKVDITKCPVCKTGQMQVTEILLPQRGPPAFKVNRNPDQKQQLR